MPNRPPDTLPVSTCGVFFFRLCRVSPASIYRVCLSLPVRKCVHLNQRYTRLGKRRDWWLRLWLFASVLRVAPLDDGQLLQPPAARRACRHSAASRLLATRPTHAASLSRSQTPIFSPSPRHPNSPGPHVASHRRPTWALNSSRPPSLRLHLPTRARSPTLASRGNGHLLLTLLFLVCRSCSNGTSAQCRTMSTPTPLTNPMTCSEYILSLFQVPPSQLRVTSLCTSCVPFGLCLTSFNHLEPCCPFSPSKHGNVAPFVRARLRHVPGGGRSGVAMSSPILNSAILPPLELLLSALPQDDDMSCRACFNPMSTSSSYRAD